ncbi:hypothetical protein SDJN03_29753, partial [Cucurbita argyrosperma subsp. sororia]
MGDHGGSCPRLATSIALRRGARLSGDAEAPFCRMWSPLQSLVLTTNHCMFESPSHLIETEFRNPPARRPLMQVADGGGGRPSSSVSVQDWKILNWSSVFFRVAVPLGSIRSAGGARGSR